MPLTIMGSDPPILDIEKSDADQLTLSWPAGSQEFVVEYATELPGGNSWAEFVSGPQLQGDRYAVQLEPAEDVRYFRLRSVSSSANTPPQLDPMEAIALTMGQSYSLQLVARDPDGDELIYSVSPLPLPEGTSLDSQTGEFVFFASEEGVYNFFFRVSDGMAIDTKPLSIDVQPPPVEGVTAISGIVLDTTSAVEGSDLPVVGATISLLGHSDIAVTDDNGEFMLSDIPAGKQILDIDARTAASAPDGSSYAGFREEIQLLERIENAVTRPFYLPRINGDSITPVSPTGETVVRNESLGITLTVPEGSAKMGPEDFTGELSISLVPENLAPAALPDVLDFAQLITIQPVGVVFSEPAAISFPNLDQMAPGSEVDIWSLDAATGQFVEVGVGRVSADGSRIDTVSGGIRAADWHGVQGAPAQGSSAPNNESNADVDKDCAVATGSRTSLRTGNLEIEHVLAPYLSLNLPQGVRLVYRSEAAAPFPVVQSDTSLSSRSGVPQTISMRMNLGGVDIGTVAAVKTDSLAGGERIRHGLGFDASAWPTGRYPYDAVITTHFQASSIGSRMQGNLFIRNERESPFGAGWMLDGLEQLNPMPNGDVLHLEGDGSMRVYTPATRPIGSLAGAISVPVHTEPEDGALGDFNEDGSLDLAVVRSSSGGVKRVGILRGLGNGSFEAMSGVEVADFPVAVTTADLDQDSHLDLVTGGNQVLLLKGQGDGSFTGPEVLLADAQNAMALTAADMDGDGLQDLAVAQANADQIAVWLNLGEGAFAEPVFFESGDSPEAMAAGDFNKDGRPDLAVATRASDNASIFLNQSTPGRISLDHSSIETGRRPTGISVADFDRNGHLDLVVANSTVQFDGRNLTLHFGLGNGVFAEPIGLRTLSLATDVITSDFNGDGFADVVSVSGGGDDGMLFPGNGAGSFGTPLVYNLGHRPTHAVVGDVDGDGDPDLISINSRSTDVSVLLNEGGDFQDTPGFATSSGPAFLAMGDFNGDNFMDVAAGNTQSGSTSVLEGDGSGFFADAKDFSAGGVPFDLETADLDLDGNLDLLVAVGQASFRALYGDGFGDFGSPETISVSGAGRLEGLLTADFDRDGFPDVALSDRQDGRLHIVRNQGEQGFSDPLSLEVGFGAGMIVSGLFNPDPHMDLAVALNSSAAAVMPLFGDGAGGFTLGSSVPVNGAANHLAAGDWNQDSIPDLVAVHTDDHAVTLLAGNGDGSFEAQPPLAVGSRPLAAALNDLDEDSQQELLIASADNNNVEIFVRNGSEGFQRVHGFSTGRSPSDLAIHDFDGDGAPDVLTPNRGSASVSLLGGVSVRVEDTFASPDGEYSQLLVNNDGSFVRQLPNGGRAEFNPDGRMTQKSDRFRNSWTYEYEGETLAQIIDPVGLSFEFTFVNGLLESITDPWERQTQFEHDAQQNLVKITDPDMTTREFEYDSTHLLVSQVSKTGEGTGYLYNSMSRHVESVLADDSRRRVEPLQMVGVRADVEPVAAIFVEDATASYQDGEGRVRTFSLNPFGQVLSMQDSLRVTTRIDRNRNGEMTQIEFANGNRDLRVVDDSGRVRNRTFLYAHTPDQPPRVRTESFDYGVFEQLRRYTDPQGHTWTFELNAQGNPTELTFPTGASAQMAWNERGQLIEFNDVEIEPGVPANVVSFEYGDAGNPVQQSVGTGENVRMTIYEKGPFHLTTKVTDPIGRETHFQYNELGFVAEITHPNGESSIYERRSDQQLTQLTAPWGGVHQYDRSPFSLVYIPPGVGKDEGSVNHQFNRAGERTGVLQPDGSQVLVQRDAAGKPECFFLLFNAELGSHGNSTPMPHTQPEDCDRTVQYHPITGEGLQIATDEVAMDFEEGARSVVTTTIGADREVVRTETYLPDGNPLVLLPGEDFVPVQYEYNVNGNAVETGEYQCEYDLADRRKECVLDNVTGEWVYNEFSQVESFTVTHSNNEGEESEVCSLGYSYNSAGALDGRITTVNGETETWECGDFDSMGHCTEEIRDDQTTLTCTYSANGVPESCTGTAGSWNYEVNETGFCEQRGTCSYSQNANGYLASRECDGTLNLFFYEGDDLVRIESSAEPDTTINWGPLHPAVVSQGEESWFLFWNNDQLFRMENEDGSEKFTFIYAPDSPRQPVYMGRNNVNYLLVYDPDGTVRLVINAETGEVAQEQDFNIVWETVEDTNPDFQPFAIHGLLNLPFLDFLYDPALKTFINPETTQTITPTVEGTKTRDANSYVPRDVYYWSDGPGSEVDLVDRADVDIPLTDRQRYIDALEAEANNIEWFLKNQSVQPGGLRNFYQDDHQRFVEVLTKLNTLVHYLKEDPTKRDLQEAEAWVDLIPDPNNPPEDQTKESTTPATGQPAGGPDHNNNTNDGRSSDSILDEMESSLSLT